MLLHAMHAVEKRLETETERELQISKYNLDAFIKYTYRIIFGISSNSKLAHTLKPHFYNEYCILRIL